MNLLEDYQIYAAGDEAPPAFHIWCGLSLLSACMGPNIWLDMGKFNIQPNLYILLVGPPGLRKSTAKDVAQHLAKDIGNIPCLPDTSTKEAVVASLSAEKSRHRMVYKWNDQPRYYTKACIFSDEFVNLVACGGDPLGWIQFLTRVYSPTPVFDADTISRGKTEMPYPYIHLLGCMTPELTSSLISQGALSGGFSRRTLYIYSNEPGPAVPFPQLTQEQKDAKQRVIARAREVQKLQGSFVLEGDAKEIYVEWYHRNYAATRVAPTQAVTNFMQSKPNQMLKLAMIHHMSSHNDFIFTREDLHFAIKHIEIAQEHIDLVFSSVGRNPHAATISGIVAFVDQHTVNPPYYLTEKRITGHFLVHSPGENTAKILNDLINAEPPQLYRNRIIVGAQTITVYTTPKNIHLFQASASAKAPALSLNLSAKRP